MGGGGGVTIGVGMDAGGVVGDGLDDGEVVGDASDGPADAAVDVLADEVDKPLGLPDDELQATSMMGTRAAPTTRRLGSQMARMSPQTTPASAGRLPTLPGRRDGRPMGYGCVRDR